MRIKLHILLVLLLLPLVVRAQSFVDVSKMAVANDSARVSLLTCAPGTSLYRLYGHTALRVREAKGTTDYAYNYGLFSLNQSGFIVKFILGLTDYSVSRESLALFGYEFANEQMPVTEQYLNLTPAEVAHVARWQNQIFEQNKYERHTYPVQGFEGMDTLIADKPDWTYRYNFLYDNCTTRAVEAIKAALKANGETLVFPNLSRDKSVMSQRDMIHEFTRNSPWYEFGQDLLLGPEVDRKFNAEDQLRYNFLPTYALRIFDAAQIRGRDGQLRPLVVAKAPLLPIESVAQQKATPLSPIFFFGTLFAFCLLLTFGQWRARKGNPIAQRAWRIWTLSFDTVLLVGLSLVGVLLTIMIGWSEHPAVGTNYLICIFNPVLLLLLLSLYLPSAVAFRKAMAALAMVGVLGYFIAFFFGNQQFPLPTVPIALMLLVRSGMIAYTSCDIVHHARHRVAHSLR